MNSLVIWWMGRSLIDVKAVILNKYKKSEEWRIYGGDHGGNHHYLDLIYLPWWVGNSFLSLERLFDGPKLKDSNAVPENLC